MNDLNLIITPSKADRSKFIGGSDVAAILGVSPWKTRLALYLEKIGESTEVITPEKQRLFDRGHRWEPIALDMLLDDLEDTHGKRPELLCRNKRYIDSGFDFLACEIDAEAIVDGEHVNLELKTVSSFAAHKWGDLGEDGQLTEDIPIEYASQTMFGLGITARRRCVVGALFGADNMVAYETIADAEIIQDMREQCRKFWVENVLARKPPDPVNLADLAKLTLRMNGRPVELNADTASKLEMVRRIRASRTTMEGEVKSLEFEIGDYIRRAWDLAPGAALPEDNAVLTFAGKTVGKWARQSMTTIDSKRLRAEAPDTAAQYERTTEFRVLRPSKPK